jgi:hypothetical protein
MSDKYDFSRLANSSMEFGIAKDAYEQRDQRPEQAKRQERPYVPGSANHYDTVKTPTQGLLGNWGLKGGKRKSKRRKVNRKSKKQSRK